MMDVFDSALIMLAGALFFSMLIERLLQIIKAVYDFLEVHYGWGEHWNRRALQLSEQIHHALQGNTVEKALGQAAKHYLKDDYPGLDGVKAVSADALRSLAVKAVCKILAVTLGVVIALLLGLDMFALIEELNKAALADAELTTVQKYFSAQYIPGWLGQVVSGIAIGIGSGPVHKLISALERSRQQRKDT
ncbi:MAG: hypothetical protein CMI03_16005 [Oceanospirillaceae bacterium]|uniref:hypothetical protein n=1 Tax=unclassified Thalassolituus TaxID=2624967 RepID=UPI000C693095|nr:MULTISPECIES: hypothetical protein [unclassified Thalassolituus]MBL33956.1 hypothetical protein [Oceanospirillaceae bacterium]MBS54243.1 hypothetical protein [Oceanospirillaceae bacterium]|tara:strand:+ start:59 stop:631 length:573 start_codon:yes stop_codon:yes gene_type:complete